MVFSSLQTLSTAVHGREGSQTPPCRRQVVQDGRLTHLQWLCLRTKSLSTKLHDRIGTKSVSHFVLTHSKKPQSRIGLQFWGRNQNRLVSWINAVKTQDSLTHAKHLCPQTFTSHGALEYKVYHSTGWTLWRLTALYRSSSLTWSSTLFFAIPSNSMRNPEECRHAPKILIYSKCPWTLLLELYWREQNSSIINGANK